MSSTKIRHEPKVLLRSTSFQKLCSIPYNFKIEAIQSYKEDIKTVIKLLKIATRTYIISIYFKFISVTLFNNYVFALWNLLKKGCAATLVNNSSAIATKPGDVGVNIANLKSIDGVKPRSKHAHSITPGILETAIDVSHTFLVYACIVYLGLQIVWLLNALSCCSNIPFGLRFLMVDLCYMGFIIYKIALNGAHYPS